MPTNFTRTLFILLCLLTLLAIRPDGSAAESASVWPGWRGPKGDGKTNETNLPTEWDQEKNILLQTKEILFFQRKTSYFIHN